MFCKILALPRVKPLVTENARALGTSSSGWVERREIIYIFFFFKNITSDVVFFVDETEVKE